MMFDIEMGDTVKCQYTGFKGVVVAKTIFINGCIQFSVVPKWNKGQALVDQEMQFDSQSLEIIKKKAKPKPIKVKVERTGGPTRKAFQRRGY